MATIKIMVHDGAHDVKSDVNPFSVETWVANQYEKHETFPTRAALLERVEEIVDEGIERRRQVAAAERTRTIADLVRLQKVAEAAP